MRSAVTPVISVTLLIFITLVAGVGAYAWFNTIQSDLQESISGSVESFPGSSCSQLNLIAMRGDGVVISNVGCDTIGTINIFIDGVLTSYDFLEPLEPGAAVTISYTALSANQSHTLQIVLSNGKIVSKSVGAFGATSEAGYAVGDEEISRVIEFYSFGVNDTLLDFSNNDNVKAQANWMGDYLSGGEWLLSKLYPPASIVNSSSTSFSSSAEWSSPVYSPKFEDVGTTVYLGIYASDSLNHKNFTNYLGVNVSSSDWRIFGHNNYGTRTTLFGSTASPSGAITWPYTAGGNIRGSASIADLDNDGVLEIVVGSATDSKIYALYANGSKMWDYTAGGNIRGSASIADLDNDGIMDIIVGSYEDHKVYALYDNGSKRWDYDVGSVIDGYCAPALADLDNDGNLEVIMCSRATKVYVLYANGSKYWEYSTGTESYSCPAVADLDNDGSPEVIFGSYATIYALHSDGSAYWSNFLSAHFDTRPAVADLDNDGSPEVIITVEDTLYAFHSDGTEYWSNNIGGGLEYSSPAVADINNDGVLEIVFGTKTNNLLQVVFANGTDFWTYSCGESNANVYSSPAIADIDNDGSPEILFGAAQTGKFYALYSDGTKYWDYTAGGQIQSSPAIGDLDGDGNYDIVFGAGDNKIYVLDNTGVALS